MLRSARAKRRPSRMDGGDDRRRRRRRLGGRRRSGGGALRRPWRRRRRRAAAAVRAARRRRVPPFASSLERPAASTGPPAWRAGRRRRRPPGKSCRGDVDGIIVRHVRQVWTRCSMESCAPSSVTRPSCLARRGGGARRGAATAAAPSSRRAASRSGGRLLEPLLERRAASPREAGGGGITPRSAALSCSSASTWLACRCLSRWTSVACSCDAIAAVCRWRSRASDECSRARQLAERATRARRARTSKAWAFMDGGELREAAEIAGAVPADAITARPDAGPWLVRGSGGGRAARCGGPLPSRPHRPTPSQPPQRAVNAEASPGCGVDGAPSRGHINDASATTACGACEASTAAISPRKLGRYGAFACGYELRLR